MTFAERLCRAREKRGWTQKDLARNSGVPYETIWRLETGKHRQPQFDVATRLARALGVTMDYLAGMYEEEKKAEDAELVAAVAV